LAKFKQTVVSTAALLILIFATPIRAGDISPPKWPAAERELAEKREAPDWAPTAARCPTWPGKMSCASTSWTAC
jgi:hypothetical protein